MTVLLTMKLSTSVLAFLLCVIVSPMPQISDSCVEIPGETYSISVYSSHMSIGNKTEDQRTKLAWLIQEQIFEFLMHCFFNSSEYIHFNGIDPKTMEIIEKTNEGHAVIQYCNLKAFILI